MNHWSKKIVFLILSSIVIFFACVSIKDSGIIRKTVATEPSDYSYFYDGMSFLKTFYRMKQGFSFYDANIYGISRDGRQGPPPLFISGWRLPTVFWLWSLTANNGQDIWFIFLCLSIVTLYVFSDISIILGGKFGAVISSVFLAQYFYFALTSYQFLLIEWWGLFPFAFGLRLFMRKFFLIGLIFMIAGVLIRELFLIPFMVLIIISWRNKNMMHLIIPIVVIFIMIYDMHFHYAAKSLFEGYAVKLNFFGQKFGTGGIVFLRQTLAYGTNFFFTTTMHIQATLIMLLLTLAGGVSSPLKGDPLNYLAPFLYIFSLLLVFLLFGTNNNDYWGIVYVPFLFSTSFKIFKDIAYFFENNKW